MYINTFGILGYYINVSLFPLHFTDPGYSSGGDRIKGSTFGQECSTPVVSDKHYWVSVMCLSVCDVIISDALCICVSYVWNM